MSLSTKNFLVAAVTLLAVGNCLRLFWQGAPCALYDSFDTGWLIQTGAYILHNGPPCHDIFSWTCPDRIFVAYQWLFELFAALLFQTGGLWLVGFSSCLLTGLLYLYALPSIWIRKGVPLAVPFALLSLVLTPHWFNARPQLLSYFLILIVVKILEHYRTTRRAEVLVFLPPLMILWANIHLFCSIGLILMIIYTACDWWRNRAGQRFAPSWLFVALIVSTVMLLVNPYGFGLISYFFTFTNGSQYMGMYEVKSSLTYSEGIFVVAYLAIAWRLLVLKRKAVPMEGWCVVALVTVAAVLIRRYESIAVLLTWPYFGMALARFNWQWLKPSGKLEIGMTQLRTANRSRFAAATAIAAIIWFARCPNEEAACNLYTEGSTRLLKLVRQYSKKGDRLFNDPTTGDWLICFETAPVLVDTRYDMYPKLFCQDIFACVYGAPGALDYIKSYRANHVLVRDDFSAICFSLAKSPDWKLVFDDGTLSFWARANDQEEERMKSLKVTDGLIRTSGLEQKLMAMTIQRRTYKYLAMANDCDAGKSDTAIALLKKGLALAPDSKDLQTELEKRLAMVKKNN